MKALLTASAVAACLSLSALTGSVFAAEHNTPGTTGESKMQAMMHHMEHCEKSGKCRDRMHRRQEKMAHRCAMLHRELSAEQIKVLAHARLIREGHDDTQTVGSVTKSANGKGYTVTIVNKTDNKVVETRHPGLNGLKPEMSEKMQRRCAKMAQMMCDMKEHAQAGAPQATEHGSGPDTSESTAP